MSVAIMEFSGQNGEQEFKLSAGNYLYYSDRFNPEAYRFNTGAAHHTFCATCGIHPFYVPRSDPDKIDVNVRCLDGVDIAALDVKQFDGRNWEHAMAGRVPWR